MRDVAVPWARAGLAGISAVRGKDVDKEAAELPEGGEAGETGTEKGRQWRPPASSLGDVDTAVLTLYAPVNGRWTSRQPVPSFG